MVKSAIWSKCFFVALGVTVALVGVRISAAPSEQNQTDLRELSRSVDRIADSLERIQRDGIEVKVSQKWSSDEFKVRVVK